MPFVPKHLKAPPSLTRSACDSSRKTAAPWPSGEIAIQPQLITFKALHIIGSSQYSMCDVRVYLESLQSHTALHEKIKALGACFKVTEINEAIAYAKSQKNVKTLLVK